MPGYKEHLKGGLFFYGISLYFLYAYSQASFWIQGERFVCTVAGSLFPDIDIKSKGQQLFFGLFFIISLVGNCLQQYQIIAYHTPILCLPLLVKHRGFFHQLWFIIIIVSYFILLLYHYHPSCLSRIVTNALFFLMGTVSHILLDHLPRKIKKGLWNIKQ